MNKPRVRKVPLTFAERLAKYPTYNPASSGFGNIRDWRAAFEQTMGHDEATRVLAGDDPLSILGFDKMPDGSALKRRYRELILKHHPDQGGNSETARKIIAAYSELIEKRK